MRRNQIAKLSEYTEFGCGWFGVSFFHLCRVTELKSHANHFFLCFSQNSYGMAVNKKSEASPQTKSVRYGPTANNEVPPFDLPTDNNIVTYEPVGNDLCPRGIWPEWR
jgi:hypothetical protein